MAKTTTLIHGDAAECTSASELILTDPPFDMPGTRLAEILEMYNAPHIVLITTMKQLMELMKNSTWQLNFDFVLDGVAPKKSKSIHQPNYTHQTGVYLTRPGTKSAFNRKRRQRHDVFENNGYWPTLFHAPRQKMQSHGMAKNENAITDLLGSFEVASVTDPFAGSGTTGLAAYALEMDCTLIEIDRTHFLSIKKMMRFVGSNLKIIEMDHEMT